MIDRLVNGGTKPAPELLPCFSQNRAIKANTEWLSASRR